MKNMTYQQALKYAFDKYSLRHAEADDFIIFMGKGMSEVQAYNAVIAKRNAQLDAK